MKKWGFAILTVGILAAFQNCSPVGFENTAIEKVDQASITTPGDTTPEVTPVVDNPQQPPDEPQIQEPPAEPVVSVIPKCGVSGNLSKPPASSSLCATGAAQNYLANASTKKYTWECKGSSSTIPCTASFIGEGLYCNQNPYREPGVQYNSSEQDIYLRQIDGNDILVERCVSYHKGQHRRENTGINCADFKMPATCCSNIGQVAINGKCKTIKSEGGSCYATSECQDGLRCAQNINHGTCIRE